MYLLDSGLRLFYYCKCYHVFKEYAIIHCGIVTLTLQLLSYLSNQFFYDCLNICIVCNWLSNEKCL
jgi:hypothetical protein